MGTANRLVEARAGKDRKEVANAVGITLSALSMYENGHRIPRDEIKVRLANFYHKTVQELFF